LLLVRDAGDVWIVYAVAVPYGVSFVVLPAALNGLLKEMLPDDLLVDANATLSTTKEALRLVGPLAGAGLFTLIGGGGVAVIDGLSFVAAAVAIAALGVREDAPQREATKWRDELLAGIRHIRADRVLTHTLIAVGVSLLVIGFMESAVFAMVDAFDRSASFVGAVVSVQGVGAVLGGVTSARIIRRLGESRSIAASLVTLASGLGVCAAAPSLAGIYVGVAVLGYALPVFIVAFNTMLQRRTPNRLMGRVSAATEVVLGTPQACSIAVGALAGRPDQLPHHLLDLRRGHRGLGRLPADRAPRIGTARDADRARRGPLGAGARGPHRRTPHRHGRRRRTLTSGLRRTVAD